MGETNLRITPHLVIPYSELTIRTSRSGGPGGQHVNKVETKVEILFDIGNSPSLSHAQRGMLLDRLGARVDSSRVLRVTVQRSRSQHQNKELALERLTELLRSAFRPIPHRVPTKPTKSSREKRVESKRRMGEKKRMRKIPPE